MGAVTAILYSMEDPSIASMVLDSPFCSLQKVSFITLLLHPFFIICSFLLLFF